MTQNDPTDHALAAIASILDHPAVKPDVIPANVKIVEVRTIAEPVPQQIDVEHYSKSGPGPLDAIRFRWTARRDEAGRYFVDETIGLTSRPLTTGPMLEEDVVRFIDDRAAAAWQRFNALKHEMATGQPATERHPDHGGGG